MIPITFKVLLESRNSCTIEYQHTMRSVDIISNVVVPLFVFSEFR